jgi:hypothetical protein
MLVETKYNPGETVFILDQGCISEIEIFSVEIEISYYGEMSVKYKYIRGNNTKSNEYEKKCYRTRQEAGEAWMKINGLEVGIK